MESIMEYLESKKGMIDSIIRKYIPEKLDAKSLEWMLGKPRHAFDPEAVTKTLSEPVWDFLGRGGKRWRPALFLLITEALGGNVEKVKEFAIVSELAHNGCVASDSMVLGNPGEQTRIDEIKPGDDVYTVNKKGELETSKVLKIKMTGERTVYNVLTSHREIKATRNHPFLVMCKDQPIRYKITPRGEERLKQEMPRGDLKGYAMLLGKSESLMKNALSARTPQLLEKNELETVFSGCGITLRKTDFREKQTKYERPDMKLGWKRLDQIKVGESIVVVRKIPDNGKPLHLPVPPKGPPKDKTQIPTQTSEKFCQMFGYILGDGCVTIDKKGSRLHISPSNNKQERVAYKRVFKDVFDCELRVGKDDGYENFVCCSYKVCWLLRELGLEKSAVQKVPEWIFGLPEKQKYAFVRGYLDSDGKVAKNGQVSFSSASEELIRGLKLLVDSIGMTTGIITKRKVKNLWKASKKKESTLWSLRMSNPQKIMRKIGTERPDYKEVMEKAKKGIDFTYDKKYPKPPMDVECLRFDTVTKIERIGIQPVYDIMVDKSHNFIAENMVVHNSIIIDDIEDLGEIRRGKPCLHKIFGEDTAINAGNFLYFLPLLVFMKNASKFDDKMLLRAYLVYAEEMMNIHFGQGTDIYWHKGKKENISEDQYLQMVSYKTGCLARQAGRLAVVMSGGSEELEEKMGRVCGSIGIAFQIADDILSIAGEEFQKGKGFGDDITEGKRSLLVIHTLKKASPEDRSRLLKILNMHTRDESLIREAIDIIKKYGSVEYSRDVAKNIVTQTWEEIDPLLKESKAKSLLKDFVSFAVDRKI